MMDEDGLNDLRSQCELDIVAVGGGGGRPYFVLHGRGQADVLLLLLQLHLQQMLSVGDDAMQCDAMQVL